MVTVFINDMLIDHVSKFETVVAKSHKLIYLIFHIFILPITRQGLLVIQCYKTEMNTHFSCRQVNTPQQTYVFFAETYELMFWLKNLRTRGIQFANTRC